MLSGNELCAASRGRVVPSNRRFAFACFGVWCFPNVPEWILLLLFTLSAFPLTSSDRARLQPRLGYFYFCRFLLLWGGSNSNWTSASGLAKDRQVRARATDGERKSGRTRNNPRIKDSGFPSMTAFSSLFTSPARLFLLSVCSPACLWTVLSSWHDQWPSTVLGCQVWVHSSVTGGELCSSVVGRWRVSWSSRQGWGGAFFPQICTWLSGFSSAGHKRPLTVWNIFIDVIFSSFFLSLIPSCTGLVQGHLKETLFAGFIGDRRLSRRVWLFESSLCVCWQGCVVQEKGGARCQMFACWLHQENIKRPFMRCCKEDQVFWEHHQTPRVIPLFKTCPGDTFLSHLLPFLLFSFLKEKGVKKKKKRLKCALAAACVPCHIVSFFKSPQFCH